MIAIRLRPLQCFERANDDSDREQGAAPAAEKAKAKDVPKVTTGEKKQEAKDVQHAMVNPDIRRERRRNRGRAEGAKDGDFPPYGPRKVRPFIGAARRSPGNSREAI
jgi:hypothetical protein